MTTDDVGALLARLREGLYVPADVLAVCDALEQAWRENICDACAGTGKPTSRRPCMCGGTGKMSDAVCGLRAEIVRLRKEYSDEMREAQRDCAAAHAEGRMDAERERGF